MIKFTRPAPIDEEAKKKEQKKGGKKGTGDLAANIKKLDVKD